MPQRKKNNRLAEGKKDKPEPYGGTPCGKRPRDMKNGGFNADLTSPSLHKLEDTGPNTLPTGLSSLPYFVSKLDKEWPADIHRALHLCPDGTFDRVGAVSPFLQAAMIPRQHRSYLILKKDDLLFLPRMVWLSGCVEMLNDLVMTTEGKRPGRKPRGSSDQCCLWSTWRARRQS